MRGWKLNRLGSLASTRVGLRVWPTLRRSEAELVDQVRQTLGAERFDQAFAAGARLQQREAIAAVRDRRGAGAAIQS